MRFLLLLAIGALSAGCLIESNPCGDSKPVPLQSGTYVSSANDNAPTPVVPGFANGAAKTLTVDRDTGMVRVSYTIDGHSVVERWRRAR